MFFMNIQLGTTIESVTFYNINKIKFNMHAVRFKMELNNIIELVLLFLQKT